MRESDFYFEEEIPPGIEPLPVRYYGDPVLRERAREVESIDGEVRRLVWQMYESLKEKEGIGLAANQVGALQRVIFVRDAIENEERKIVSWDRPRVVINPVLTLPTEEVEVQGEGCLSVPKLYLDIERPIGITLQGMNLQGQQITKTLYGFAARQYMHEVDHLNGVLFMDRLPKKERMKLKDRLKQLQKKYRKL